MKAIRADPERALFPNNPGLAMFGQPHWDLFSAGIALRRPGDPMPAKSQDAQP
jgi:hypothetical protein